MNINRAVTSFTALREQDFAAVIAGLNNGDEKMANLPENPTPEVIETVFEIMKMKLEYANEGVAKQDEHNVHDTGFGMKAVAYDRLIEYLNTLDSDV